jgi:hypothetical protein
VLGLGSHGSACLYNLAKWGSRVSGVVQYCQDSSSIQSLYVRPRWFAHASGSAVQTTQCFQTSRTGTKQQQYYQWSLATMVLTGMLTSSVV